MPRFIGQAEFGGGMFRGRRAPRDSVYDAVNALVDDERLLYRRGGVALKTTEDALDTLVGVYASETWRGQRTICWDTDGALYVVDSDGVSLHNMSGAGVGGAAHAALGLVASGYTGKPFAAPIAIGGYIVLRSFRPTSATPNPTVIVYAGSRKAKYATGTVTVTQGSAVVTGAGTAFLANVEPGMVFATSLSSGAVRIVKSVDSDTQITLTEAWTLTGGSTAYGIGDSAEFDYTTLDFKPGSEVPFSIGTVGAPPRLLLGMSNRLYFAPAGSIALDPDDYHELPQGAQILGISDLRDSAMVFTDDGMWGVSNFELDALDDFGNIQHRIERISQDMILWGEQGLAGYAGQLLVPCRDDVFVVTPDGPPAPITRSVRPLYRQYVRDGFRPGIAAVYRGHYLLPIVDSDGDTVQDVLTCRLDLLDSRGAARPAWTRQDDQAASTAYARADNELLGVSGLRVTDLTDIFDPSLSNQDDADGTDHGFQVVTQDYEAGQIPHTFTGARVALEMAAAARVNLATNPKAGSGVTTGWVADALVLMVPGELGVAIGPDPTAEMAAAGLTTGIQATSLGAGDGVALSFPVVTGQTYTVSVYVGEVGLVDNTEILRVALRDSGGANEDTFDITADTSDWQRVELTALADETATWTLEFEHVGGTGVTWHWTGALVEQASAVADYFDGDTPGAEWSGVEELSTSVANGDGEFEVEYASGGEDEVFTSAGSRLSGEDGQPEAFRFSRRARAVRLRVTVTSLVTRAVLRSVELVFRERGRS